MSISRTTCVAGDRQCLNPFLRLQILASPIPKWFAIDAHTSIGCTPSLLTVVLHGLMGDTGACRTHAIADPLPEATQSRLGIRGTDSFRISNQNLGSDN